jgi:hypothetical protein
MGLPILLSNRYSFSKYVHTMVTTFFHCRYILLLSYITPGHDTLSYLSTNMQSTQVLSSFSLSIHITDLFVQHVVHNLDINNSM